MTIHESECVTLKRHGAEYVDQLLAHKSIKEKLDFWKERTENLRIQSKEKNKYTLNQA